MFRRSLSCVCAGLLTATGLDFLALLADVRAPLGFALVAAFVAVLGLRGLATSLRIRGPPCRQIFTT
jgi:hypothetical protein